jgi:hypothetical protein
MASAFCTLCASMKIYAPRASRRSASLHRTVFALDNNEMKHRKWMRATARVDVGGNENEMKQISIMTRE